MPGLQARSPVRGEWEATTHWYFPPFLPPSPSLKINKILKNLNGQITDWMTFITCMHTEHQQINKKKNHPDFLMCEGLEQILLRRRYMNGQIAHEKMCNTTVIVINTTMKYHYIPASMASSSLNVQRTWTDTSQKKIHESTNCTWKDVQHYRGNKCYSEVPPHTHWYGCNKNDWRKQIIDKYMRNWISSVARKPIWRNNVVVSDKIKNFYLLILQNL